MAQPTLLCWLLSGLEMLRRTLALPFPPSGPEGARGKRETGGGVPGPWKVASIFILMILHLSED